MSSEKWANAEDGAHLFIADSLEAFAVKTVQLITDADLYRRMVTNARDLVVNRYDGDAIAGHLSQLYEELAGPCDTSSESVTLLAHPTQ